MWQMDALRRYAAGDLAEIVGPAGWKPIANRASCACAASRNRSTPPCRQGDRAQFAGLRARSQSIILETHRSRFPLSSRSWVTIPSHGAPSTAS